MFRLGSCPLFFLSVAWLCMTLGTVLGASTSVRIKIIDATTGSTTPAMVCITDLKQGKTYLPPDGKPDPNPCTTKEFYDGISFSQDKNWVGPVRKTSGIGDNLDRSYVYGQIPSLPFWKEPVIYQVSGDFSIRLQEGDYRIAVSRGMEFVPASKEFHVGTASSNVTIIMQRWINLADEGWYSGDVHVHHPTTEATFQDYLLSYAEAEDIRIVNVLEQHHHDLEKPHQEGIHSKQLGFGKKFRREQRGRWLVSGQEAPSSTFGHIVGLNIEHLAYDHYYEDFYDLTFRDIHTDDNALVGYAHFAWNGCDLPRGFAWYVTTGEIDFVELLQFTKLNAIGYYDYLNLGFRLTAAAGSDVPWGSTLGEVRTYVHTGEQFDPDRWFAGLAAGHSFVTNGPALEFKVDGKLPGSTIEMAREAEINLFARVRCHPKIGRLKVLRIVGNEGVLQEITPQQEEHELILQDTVPIEHSQWIVASAECENGAVAHSSPIYVIVDKHPHWSRRRGAELIEKQLAVIKQIRREFANREDPRSHGIQKRLDKAETFYSKLEAAMQENEKMPLFWTVD